MIEPVTLASMPIISLQLLFRSIMHPTLNLHPRVPPRFHHETFMCLKDFSCDLTQFFCFRGRKKSTATASTPAAVKKRSPSPPKLSPQKKTPSPAKTPGKRGRPLGSGSKKTTTRYNNENIRCIFSPRPWFALFGTP